MSSDPNTEQSRSVTEGPVTVTKSFEAEEFPVPAMKFVIESTASEPVTVRLVDSIPEEFPMENVGFHPEFEKDNWTAYKTHRVEYDRTLEPGETTTTVYGIRLDDTDPTAFLTAPTLTLLDADHPDSTDQAIDDVLGEDSNQLVRDVLSGERESLPGMEGDDESDAGGVDAPDLTVDAAGGLDEDAQAEDLELNLDDETEDEAEDDADTPRPHTFDESGTPATERAVHDVAAAGTNGSATDADSGEEDGDLELDLDDPTETAEDEEVGVDSEELTIDEAESGATDVRDDDTGAVAGARSTVTGSLVEALAAELRDGDVDDDDVAALREALGAETAEEGEGEAEVSIPRSLDVRIKRLQNQVQDLAAYSDGMQEFLDEEGTAQELISGFREDVQETRAEADALAERADEADGDRRRLREDVRDLRSDLSDFDDRLDVLDDRLESTTDRLGALDERVDETDERFDAVDERFDAVDERLDAVGERAAHADEAAEDLYDEVGEVREELATLDGDITDAREAFDAELDDVRDDVTGLQSDLSDLDATVEEFRSFRDRLSNALGPMVGGAGDAAGDDERGDDDDGEASGEDHDDGDGDGDDDHE